MFQLLRRVHTDHPVDRHTSFIHLFLLDWHLWSIKRTRITRSDDKDYLIRYSLLTLPWFSIKLHHILTSDDDCLHDHPWSFLSILLRGVYFEVSDRGMIRCARGSVLFRKASWRHRLIIYQPVWSLVITFKKTKEWGFYTKEGFVHHRSYDSKMCE